MIYVWTIVIIFSTSFLGAEAFYKRVSGQDLRRSYTYEQENENRAYIDRIRPKISDKWDPLKSARPLKTVYYVTVQPSGHITDIERKYSSGDKFYDKSCKQALMSASPFKKPDHTRRVAIMFESHKTKDINPVSSATSAMAKPFKMLF